MKLLILTVEFRGMRGGVADYTYHLGRALSARGIETAVLTTDHREVRRDEAVEVIPEIRSWTTFGALSILRKIRSLRPDVVNLHYVPYGYNYHGVPVYIAGLAAAVRAMGFRQVTTFHEVAARFRWLYPKYWGVVILQRAIAHLLGLSSDRIIAVGEFNEAMLGRFRSKTHCIPVGSNFPPVEVADAERMRLRARIAPAGEAIIATFAGGAWYRPVRVLEAAKVLIASGRRSVKLVILGGQGTKIRRGGRSLAHVAADLGIGDAVTITGYLEEDDVFRHLAASDLFALIDESLFGGVSAKSTLLIAAYAAGLPIVANRGLLTDRLFVHGENIDLIDSTEADDIARALGRLLDDPDRRRLLAEGARKTYRDRFTWDRVARGYLHALSELSQQREAR